MRLAEVETVFLKDFGELYPQLVFRSMRRYPKRRHAPYAFALRVGFGRTGPDLDLVCALATDGHPEQILRTVRSIKQDPRPPGPDESMSQK